MRDIATMLHFHRIKTEGISGTRSSLDQSLLARLVFSRYFDILSTVVILSNAVLMGVGLDYAVSHLGDPIPRTFELLETAFAIFYLLEVGLRIAVHKYYYFVNKDWRWNWFDLLIVVCAIFDQIQEFMFTTSAIAGKVIKNVSLLRVMRLMKMVRLLRMIRLLRAFRELRLILNSVLGCLKSIMWASILIVVISYIFGLFFLQICTNFLVDNAKNPDSFPETREQIARYWNSLGRSMLSLYMASSAGREWADIGEPLLGVGIIVYCAFLLYIGFFMFVVVNTLTSMFVESTLMQAEDDDQAVIQTTLHMKDDYIHKLQALYDEIDDDGSGEISYEEFCKVAHRPELHAFAASLDIDISDAKHFFYILSARGTRAVDIETFVVACIKLRGTAKSVDLMDLVVHQEDFVFDCTDRLERLEQFLETPLRLLPPAPTLGPGAAPAPVPGTGISSNAATAADAMTRSAYSL